MIGVCTGKQYSDHTGSDIMIREPGFYFAQLWEPYQIIFFWLYYYFDRNDTLSCHIFTHLHHIQPESSVNTKHIWKVLAGWFLLKCSTNDIACLKMQWCLKLGTKWTFWLYSLAKLQYHCTPVFLKVDK